MVRCIWALEPSELSELLENGNYADKVGHSSMTLRTISGLCPLPPFLSWIFLFSAFWLPWKPEMWAFCGTHPPAIFSPWIRWPRTEICETLIGSLAWVCKSVIWHSTEKLIDRLIKYKPKQSMPENPKYVIQQDSLPPWGYIRVHYIQRLFTMAL